jgi:hypothetical protein
MRNRLIHAYFDINLDILWKTITEDLPPLVAELEKRNLVGEIGGHTVGVTGRGVELVTGRKDDREIEATNPQPSNRMVFLPEKVKPRTRRTLFFFWLPDLVQI